MEFQHAKNINEESGCGRSHTPPRLPVLGRLAGLLGAFGVARLTETGEPWPGPASLSLSALSLRSPSLAYT